MTGNLYAALGIQRSATPEEIKAAYRKAAKECHPDHHPGDTAKVARFQLVSQAYSVLSDPEQRAAYDRLSSGVSAETLAHVISDFFECWTIGKTGSAKQGIAEFFDRTRKSPHWDAVQAAMAAPPQPPPAPRAAAPGRRTRADLAAELAELRAENARLRKGG